MPLSALLILSSIILSSASLSEVIKLKNGKVLNAEIVSRNESNIIIRLNGTRMVIAKKDMINSGALSAKDFIRLGDEYLKCKNYQEAIAQYEKASSLDTTTSSGLILSAKKLWKEEIINNLRAMPIEEQEKYLIKAISHESVRGAPPKDVLQSWLKDIYYQKARLAANRMGIEECNQYLKKGLGLPSMSADVRLYNHGYDDEGARKILREAWNNPENDQKRTEIYRHNLPKQLEKEFQDNQVKNSNIAKSEAERLLDLKRKRELLARQTEASQKVTSVDITIIEIKMKTK